MEEDRVEMEHNYKFDDEKQCCGCIYHRYKIGKNYCKLGNHCDDYDEDNPCYEFDGQYM